MHPQTCTFDKLRGIAPGVAQYVVGLFDLQCNRRPGTMKMVLENEPSWLNMEAFKAARVLIKEVSAFYHREDMEVTHWGLAFVYHPSEINLPRSLHERFPKILQADVGCIYQHWWSICIL